MPQADPEGREARGGQLADILDRVADRRGIPRPLERNNPSGESARTWSGVVSAGTTVTRQPASASIVTMLCFIPKS
jgi:hypothetical protein